MNAISSNAIAALAKYVHISRGALEVRLLKPHEMQQALRFRHHAFFTTPDTSTVLVSEKADAHAHHLAVFDRERKHNAQIIAYVRLLSTNQLPKHDLSLFYTAQYYELADLVAAHGSCLELSRFCIDPTQKQRLVLKLMWDAIIRYIEWADNSLMFGIASFPGCSLTQHQNALSYLYRHHASSHSTWMMPCADNAIDLSAFNESIERISLTHLPPLIRLYIKMRAEISQHAYLDPKFNSTFVMLYVSRENMEQFGRPTRAN